MRITFNGDSPVDIPGVDDVQPGSTVEVDDQVGASLLQAGSSVDADGKVTPAESPLWTAPKSSNKPAAQVASTNEVAP